MTQKSIKTDRFGPGYQFNMLLVMLLGLLEPKSLSYLILISWGLGTHWVGGTHPRFWPGSPNPPNWGVLVYWVNPTQRSPYLLSYLKHHYR